MRHRPPEGFIEPSIPVLADHVPLGPDWVHELKHDGMRIVARVAGKHVWVWSRHGRSWTASFPGIVEALLLLPTDDFVIDGEVVAHDAEGMPDFHVLRSRRGMLSAVYYVFDALQLDGRDLRPLPLKERREILDTILAPHFVAPLTLVETMPGSQGETMFRHACWMGLEGIVSKRLDRRYRSGHNPDRRKVKCPAYTRRGT